MVILTNATPEKTDSTLLDAMQKEISAYWLYTDMIKNTEDRRHKAALCEIVEDEFLHAKYLRKYMVEHHMYDMKEPYEEKYRDMVVDKMVNLYGWDD